MELESYGIDPRLLSASDGLGERAIFHEKMLYHVLGKAENVCARILLSVGREEVFLLPYLQTRALAIDATPPRALVLAHDRSGLLRITQALRGLGRGLGLRVSLLLSEDSSAEAPSPSIALEGEQDADLIVGSVPGLTAAAEEGLLDLRAFRWLIADELDRIADLPSDLLRRFQIQLLPSWERRSILVSDRLTVRAKNLAWDLADNPRELVIEEDAIKAQSLPLETWQVPTESKFKFLLSVIRREEVSPFCVFCNLPITAEEVARRLQPNGIRSALLARRLAPEELGRLLEHAQADRAEAFIFTDEGAEGLDSITFPLLVNFDIPLEPELFISRLGRVDRNSKAAKVVNIACDRYIYGLTAVEQRINATLNAMPVEPQSLDIEDRSDQRQPEPVRESRPEANRGYPGRDQGRRGRGSSNAPRPGDDRSPDIRRSIAEATGGSLDVGSNETRGSDARPAPGRNPQAGNRSRQPAQPRARQKAGAGRDRGGPPRGGAADRGAVNPYALTMEERMRRYREKYGDRMTKPAENAPGPGRDRGRKDQLSKAQRRAEHAGPRQERNGRKDPGRQGAAPGGNSSPRSASAGGPAPREPGAGTGGSAEGDRRSLLDRVKDAFRKGES
ncbi:MAG TPA: helicase-related protein [Rectinemataceae bacterium]|nr:helicase-related protein [Rectinemataceae bacterium]